MRLVLVVACFLLFLRSGFGAEDPGTVAPAPTPPAATADLSIADALEGISDEDKPTREKALKRLEHATADDIPALEKVADSPDLETRKQVALILKRLKRGELAAILKYPDGTPAANIKVSVTAYPGLLDKVQGGRQAQKMLARINPQLQTLVSGDYTTDAAGKIAVGQFNDNPYTLVLTPTDPLPAQTLTGGVTLTQHSPPINLEVRRGISGPITVADEDGKPVPDASLLYLSESTLLDQYRAMPVSQVVQISPTFSCGTTDEKGVAEVKLLGGGNVILVAVKDGYDLAVEPDIKAEDGSRINISFKLVKTKPIKLTVTCRDRQGTTLKAHRILLVRPKDLLKVMGNQWFNSADVKKIPSYIENGAIDLDSSDDTGAVSHELMPDIYWAFAFGKDGKTFYATINDATKTGTVAGIFNEMAKPGR